MQGNKQNDPVVTEGFEQYVSQGLQAGNTERPPLRQLIEDPDLSQADRLDRIGQELGRYREAGRELSDEDRQKVVGLVEQGMATKQYEISGSDPAAQAANKALEPQQMAAMSAARSLAQADREEANPFQDEQLTRAYQSERTFLNHQAASQDIDTNEEQIPDGVDEARQVDEQVIEAEDGDNSIEPYIEQDKAQSADEDARDWLSKRRQSIEDLVGQPADQAPAEAAEESTAPTPPASPQNQDSFEELGEEHRPVIPERVAQNYVELEGKYYFANRPEQLAFVDKGNRLQSKLNNAEIATSMVDMAEGRGWTEIQVKGTKDFRRQAWLEATARGIEARGYKPNEQDLVRLKQLTDRRGENTIDGPGEPKTPADTEAPKTTESQASNESGSAPSQAQPQSQGATTEQPAEPVNRLAGKLMEHGEAPYENNPENRANYYVTLENSDGERSTTWGVDLKRAIEDRQVEVGQQVELENKGREPVTVSRPVRDEQGKVVSKEEVNTFRNAWEIKAEALRDRERDPKELVKEHPDLVNEVAALKVAEKFSQRFTNEADQTRFINQVRERMAENVEKGQSMEDMSIREQRVVENENSNER